MILAVLALAVSLPTASAENPDASAGSSPTSGEPPVATEPAQPAADGSVVGPTPVEPAPAEPAPTAATEAPAPAEPVEDPNAGARYVELHLLRVPDDDGAWEIRDGRGGVVDAETYALLTGDAALLARIDDARRGARKTRWTLLGTGAAVALTSLIPVLTMEDPLVANEGTPAFSDLSLRNDVRVAAAFSLVGTGSILAGIGLAAEDAALRRARQPSRHQDAATAEAVVTGYNARLADKLGLAAPPDDTVELTPDGG